MKRAILFIFVGALLGAVAVWMKTHPAGGAPEADEHPAESAAAEESLTRDPDGNAVIKLNAETQRTIGLAVAHPESAQLAPEVKGFGRILDPAPLAALMTELSTSQSAYAASSNDLARLQSLAGQGNASERALQTAQAAAQRDLAALQSAKNRLFLTWGVEIANRENLPEFVQSLVGLEKLLVRIDLPLGEKLDAPPTGARLTTLSGQTMESEFLSAAASVDPQFQGRGFLFVVPSNSLHLLAGEAVTGFLQTAGQPEKGVIISREAVVRANGRGWAYVKNADGESFTRKPVALDHPVEHGWFAADGFRPEDQVVTTGAQILLSEEMKSTLSAD